MANQKITPSIWFNNESGTLGPVFNYYKKLFGDQFQSLYLTPLGKSPSGNAEIGGFSLFGQQYSSICTSQPHHELNDSFSLIIECNTQEEIDKYWDYFTTEGKESQCGWCIDKHGLRWQVIPANLGELMAKPNAHEVMMRQKKIIISEY